MRPLRLLFLAPFPPRVDANHGGSRAIGDLLVHLGRRHEIALLHLRAPNEAPVDRAVAQACTILEEVRRPEPPTGGAARWADHLRLALRLARGQPMWVSRSRVPAFADAARALAARFRPDLVQLEYHVMGQYLPALAGHDSPRVLRQLEPGSLASRERVGQGWGRLLLALDARAWRRYERSVVRRVDAVVALTQRDAAELSRLGPAEIAVVPLGIAIPPQALDSEGRSPAVLFVGNFIHSPNVDAAERLVSAVFPQVRALCPGALLRLVGPNPPEHLRALAGSGVTVTGAVQDLVGYMEEAAVVVAPLRLGGGMRVKVLEALAAGKAVVATPLAVDGLPVRDGAEVLLAESDTQLARALVDLLQHPERRRDLGRRARAFAEAHLGWDEPVATLERLYERLLA